ncbi:hypothetical protein RCH12_003224 [Cryobacterium sp. MP_3.1]|nr:hypothetical protein [Cryobacterium sp. MP_3.1]
MLNPSVNADRKQPAQAASALFQVINQRYLKTSIVITTNRPLSAATPQPVTSLAPPLQRATIESVA